MRTASYKCVECGRVQCEPCIVAGRHSLAGACESCYGDMVCEVPTIGDARLPVEATGLLTLRAVADRLEQQLPLLFLPGIACRYCGRPMEAAEGSSLLVCEHCDNGGR